MKAMLPPDQKLLQFRVPTQDAEKLAAAAAAESRSIANYMRRLLQRTLSESERTEVTN